MTRKHFWSINPKIYNQYREAYIEFEKAKLKQADFLNHLLGKYISIGVNDPKKYPDKPFLTAQASEDLPDMTDDEMERQARHNTIRMGGIIKT